MLNVDNFRICLHSVLQTIQEKLRSFHKDRLQLRL
jgi:hypothetical protein